MKKLFIVFLSMVCLSSLRAERVWNYSFNNCWEYEIEENEDQAFKCYWGSLYRAKKADNLYLLVVNNSYPRLLMYWNPSETKKTINIVSKAYNDEIADREIATEVTIPRGWVILDAEGADALNIPDIVGWGMHYEMVDGWMKTVYDDPVVYIEEEALDRVQTVNFQKSNQEIIIGRNNSEGNIQKMTINRPVRFLAGIYHHPNVSFSSDLTTYPRGLYYFGESTLTIPDQFTTLPDYCFRDAVKLQEVKLPETLSTIGNECFANSDITTFRFPYYLEKIGDKVFDGCKVKNVYFPWLSKDLSCVGKTGLFDSRQGDIFGDKFAQFGSINFYKPYSVNLGKDYSPQSDGMASAIAFNFLDKQLKSAYAYYLWHNGTVKSVEMQADAKNLVQPQLEDNDVLLVSKDANFNDDKNVVKIWRDNNKVLAKCEHLQISDSYGETAKVNPFSLPFDTYCNEVIFNSKRQGFFKTAFPFPVISDLTRIVAHADAKVGNEGTRYLPIDTLPALQSSVFLKSTSFEDLTMIPASASDYLNDKNHLIMASEPLTIEEMPETGDNAKPVYNMGFSHEESMTIPTLTDKGGFDIKTLGDLYFFEAYGQLAHDSIHLRRNFWLTNSDKWHTVSRLGTALNGHGYKISNLHVVEGLDPERVGFIGKLEETGSVERLAIAGVLQVDPDQNTVYTDAGGLVARDLGTVSDCVVDMNIAVDAYNAGILVGSMDWNLNMPVRSLVIGSLWAYQDHGSNSRYGIFYGGWDRTDQTDVYDRDKGNAAYTKFATADNALKTNFMSDATYLKVGNSLTPSYLTSPKNYNGFEAMWDTDIWDTTKDKYIYWYQTSQQNLYDGSFNKAHYSGALSRPMNLRQNVSLLMAPLDSIPAPYLDDRSFQYKSSCSVSRLGYSLPAHNCADYTGSGECGACPIKGVPQDLGIEIKTAEELKAFAAEVNSATEPKHWHVRLGADIDLQDEAWTPIGNAPAITYEDLAQSSVHYDGVAFRGIFDGQGHTIKGINVNNTQNNQGFFGVLHDNALVCRLVLEGNVQGGNAAGGVAGLMSRSEISSVISHVKVKGQSQVGGLVGAMVGAHARLANSVCLGTSESTDPENGKMIGRVVGQADANRSIGWDIQPVTIQNVYIPEQEADQLYVGSGTVLGSRVYEAAPCSFSNDSVNQAILKTYYPQLLSVIYGLTSKKLQTALPVESEAPATPEVVPPAEDDNLVLKDGYYQIGNAAQLRKFAELVNSQKTSIELSAQLTADIDLQCKTNGEWTPMGPDKIPYMGTFDGCGHTIKGLYTSSSTASAGLFGAVKSATIERIRIEGDGISSSSYVGAIAGMASNSTIIRDCYVACPVTCINSARVAGGVVGALSKDSQIHNCLVTSSVTNTKKATAAGILVGYGQTGATKAYNCCYLPVGTLKAYGPSCSAKDFVECTEVAQEGLASGLAAYQLQSRALPADTTLWGQTFGQDSVPTLGGKCLYSAADKGYDFDYYNVDTVMVKEDNNEVQNFTYIVHRMTLNDEADGLNLPLDISTLKAVEVAYSRQNLVGYNSLCLPVTLPQSKLPEGVILGRLSAEEPYSNDEKKQTLRFSPVSVLPSNIPGIVFMEDKDNMNNYYDLNLVIGAADNDGYLYDVNYSAEPTDTQGAVTLKGAYATKQIGVGYYKLSNDGDVLLKTTEKSHVYPYRWYMNISSTRAAQFEDCEISIEPASPVSALNSASNGKCFDVLGRTVNPDHLQSGIYIQQGHKRIKK